jgi:CheY-specific phosphatase CheX
MSKEFDKPVYSVSFNETDLRSFLDTIIHYFSELTGETPTCEVPYFKQNTENLIFDHSGTINISGSYRGSIIMTAEMGFLIHFLGKMGMPIKSPAIVSDSVGEIANVIAGNLQKHFGGQFIISLPTITSGQAPEVMALLDSRRGYILPVTWDGFNANLIALFD